MKRKHKKAGSKPAPPYYDRKVRREGYTRSLSLGKVIPKDWRYVRIHVVYRSDKFINIQLEKLLGDETNTQPDKTGKTSEQNTQAPRPAHSS